VGEDEMMELTEAALAMSDDLDFKDDGYIELVLRVLGLMCDNQHRGLQVSALFCTNFVLLRGKKCVMEMYTSSSVVELSTRPSVERTPVKRTICLGPQGVPSSQVFYCNILNKLTERNIEISRERLTERDIEIRERISRVSKS
jgi:hypothetical protein